MAETIGILIIAGATGGEVAGIAGLGTLATSTVFGTSLATVVGTAAIIGVSIGLQYALNNPDVPPPENGSQAFKQSIPPRIRAYGRCRLAGYYMCFEAGGSPPANSYDVIAFHSGEIDRIEQVFLSDDGVAFSADINTGAPVTVLPYGDGRYNAFTTSSAGVLLQARLGAPSQSALSLFTGDANINTIWTGAHQGNGIAYLGMACGSGIEPSIYSRVFPRGRPEPSVGVRASRCYDPRFNDVRFTQNPVIQLMDYLTHADGGMGLDFDRAIAPNLARWIEEANHCDTLVDTAAGTVEPRYQCGGFYAFDNAPENVINSILATCDGWLAETGDGGLTITVGIYRAPTDPPLTDKHIFGFGLNYGTSDEQTINQLDVSFTDPGNKYVSVQADPWRDEAAISASGQVRAKPLDLTWCQSLGQARRLADRAMMRLNPLMTGTFTTSLYGLRYLGHRWVPLQYPFVSGLQDCVVEIQDVQIDLARGRITWTFIRIEPQFIEAYNPASDQGGAPVVPPPTVPQSYHREDITALTREAGGDYIREST